MTGPEAVADAAGYAQGLAFSFGSGRVYVSGEAGMFTAEVLGGRGGGLRWMHAQPRDQNQQFLLNVLHWLDGDFEAR